MTEKRRKILSCILICISIIVIFAGCKNNKTDAVATDVSQSTQIADDKTTVTTSSTDESTSAPDKTTDATTINESTGTTTANDKTTHATTAYSKKATATTKKAVKKTTTKKTTAKSTTSKKTTAKTTTYEYTTVTTPNVGEDFITHILDDNAFYVFNKKTGEFKIDCHGNFFTAYADYWESFDKMYYTHEEFDGNNVKSIYFKDGVTVIGYNPICYFVNATEVTIPKSVKRILRKSFPASMNIETINYGGTEEDWKKIVIDNNDNEAIQNCKSINYNVKIEKSTVSDSANYEFNQRYKTTYFNYDYDTMTPAITVKLDYYTGVVTVSGKGRTERDREELYGNPDSIQGSFMEYPLGWPEGWGFFTINTVKYEEGITVITEINCAGSSAYTVYIPKSVKTIEKDAFYNNKYLKDVYYAGTEKEWKQIKIEKEGNEDLLNATIHFR